MPSSFPGPLLAAIAALSCVPAPPPSHPPPGADLHALVAAVSAGRLESDLRRLVAFGTRHTLSDTLSPHRGIGAARRWVKAQFDSISGSCGGCLSVRYQERLVPGEPGTRIPGNVMIVNVLATLRGADHPERHILMTAHLDSRASDPMDSTSDAPGAADDGSGVVAVLEAARLLARPGGWGKSLVFGVLSGEEQGLYGGTQLAAMAADSGWIIEGVLNNDIIGHRAGMAGEANDREFRVFSEPVPANEPDSLRWVRRFTGGEVDGNSRQLARYVERLTRRYLPETRAVMIYRLDRFGRGGDHRPFNDLGFPAVRLTAMHEDYHRQHQDVRTENGIAYGDVIGEVSFAYIARVTGANVATLAALASAPPPPAEVRLQGAVTPHTVLRWSRIPSPRLVGYRLYWRETTEPQWRYSVDAGDVETFALENVSIDNYLFGVAARGADGRESVIIFAR